MAKTGIAPSASDYRLGDQQHDGPGRRPEERHEQVHDRREVIAPGVHLGQAHVGPAAPREIPRELDVVAEIERMGLKREMARDGDKGEQDRVGGYAGPQHAARLERGHGYRRRPQARGDHHEQQQEDVLGPLTTRPGPSSRTAETTRGPPDDQRGPVEETGRGQRPARGAEPGPRRV